MNELNTFKVTYIFSEPDGVDRLPAQIVNSIRQNYSVIETYEPDKGSIIIYLEKKNE